MRTRIPVWLPLCERVLRVREIQAEGFKGLKDVYSNAQMTSRMVHEVCQLTDAGLTPLKTAMERLQPSARAFDCILKVARTAADLAEAIHYRSLDREDWAG